MFITYRTSVAEDCPSQPNVNDSRSGAHNYKAAGFCAMPLVPLSSLKRAPGRLHRKLCTCDVLRRLSRSHRTFIRVAFIWPNPKSRLKVLHCSSCLAQTERNGDRGFYADRLPVEEEWFVPPLFHRVDCSRSEHRVTSYNLQVLNNAVFIDERR
jgi:hypothetical protein